MHRLPGAPTMYTQAAKRTNHMQGHIEKGAVLLCCDWLCTLAYENTLSKAKRNQSEINF